MQGDGITKQECEEFFSNNSTVVVTFIKRSGEKRVMVCTTDMSLIPVDKHPKSEYVQSDVKFNVFDLEKGEWRSFNYESVIDIR